jgi:hypothetical protein
MYTNQKIPCVNGPWWFIQMWLQLYMHQIVGIDLKNRHFPSTNYKEGEKHINKGCQTYGEAAFSISINQNIGQLFELFKGFANPLWFPYLNSDNLTLPYEFSFETGCIDVRSTEIFNIFIHTCILPAEFCGGRQVHSTYEYYQPNIMARQLGCGQVPLRLFLHEFLKPREEIKEALQARRIFEYQCSPTVYAPQPFVPTTIVHPSFTSWWQEFRDHTFNKPVHSFCFELMPYFQPTSEVIYLLLPLSQSCPSLLIRILCHFLQDTVPAPCARTISYNIPGPISALGFHSTTLAQLMSRYATSDPTPISSASDKRKAPSLVAPPAAKKKRTSKRVLIEVNIFSSLSIKPFFILITLSCILSDQSSATNNHHRTCQSPTCW